MSEAKERLQYPDYHMGAEVAKNLKQKKMLQKTLAKGIGVHPAAIPRFFKKKRLPNDRVKAMSTFIGVDLFTFYLSSQSQAYLEKGKTAHLLEAEVASLRTQLEEQSSQHQQQQERIGKELEEPLQAELANLRQEIVALKSSLEEEKAQRQQAETKVQVLEGKLEIIKEMGLGQGPKD